MASEMSVAAIGSSKAVDSAVATPTPAPVLWGRQGKARFLLVGWRSPALLTGSLGWEEGPGCVGQQLVNGEQTDGLGQQAPLQLA